MQNNETEQKKVDSYILRVLIAIDQLGNALAGGHPYYTISSRTGYFANIEDTSFRPWWRIMEAIIDFAFLPIDGPKHCLKNYEEDKNKGPLREGSDFTRAILGTFIILACIPISIFTRIWVMISPDCGYKPNNKS